MMQELSLNVLDVAQNSVRADASLICIEVDEQPKNDWLTITISDNGCGMTAKQISQVTDPFFTTRTTRKVGLGVPFFKMAAELTGGALNIDSQLGNGTTVTASFGLSHIDRMPLGDMAGTVCTLIQCNPDVDFVYTRRYGERSFSADTREFRKTLGDIPLQTPEVLRFIGEFIRENSAEIQSQCDK